LTLQAFASGFRGVDVAGQRKHYREDLVGEAVHAAKEELGIDRIQLWLQSKFTPLSGQDLTGPVPYDQDARPRDAVLTSFNASLRNLHKGDQWSFNATNEKGKQRAWLDSYLLHSPLNTLEETLEAWATMEELVEQGLVRMIGYSNVYDARILQALRRSAKRHSPRIVQNRWHHTSGHDVSLLSSFSPALSPNDGAEAGGIVYQPFWTLTGNPRLLRSQVVKDAASKRGWTAAQVVYNFVSQGFGIPGLRCTVLSGTTDLQHMHEAVQAVLAKEDRLDEEEVEQIRKIIYGE
jgi:diketogulonate reductase-like aldo/keto reductase